MYTVTRTFILLLLCAVGSSAVAQDACVWRQKASLPTTGREGSAAFTIDGYGYVVGGGYFDVSPFTYYADLWRYNPATDTWTEMAPFPGDGGNVGVAVVIDGKAYVGLGMREDGVTNDWWSYDPATNTWTQLANYPDLRYQPFAFAAGGLAYVGGGMSFTAMTDMSTVYAYNPATDTWTQVADYPTVVRDNNGVTLNGEGYVIGGSVFNGMWHEAVNEVYRYDAASNTWVAVAPIPGYGHYGPVVWSTGNYAFYGTGSLVYELDGEWYYEYATDRFLMYDAANDTWTELGSLPVVRSFISQSFAIGDKGYISGGSDWDYWDNPEGLTYNTLWEYSCGPVQCNAVSVTELNQGLRKNGTAVPPGHSKHENAIGMNNQHISLGFGGSVTLRLDYIVRDGDGCDIEIIEASPANATCSNNPETALVEVSLTGEEWTSVGTVCNSGCVDIAGAGPVQYVRITDTSNPADFQQGSADGFDVRAIAITGCGGAMRYDALMEDEFTLTLYPNPAETNITVQLPEGGGELRIVNALGQTVYAQSVENEKALVDVSQLASGVYQVRFDNGFVQTLNFVKQ